MTKSRSELPMAGLPETDALLARVPEGTTPGKWCVSNGALVRVAAYHKGRVYTIAGVHRQGRLGGNGAGCPLANAALIALAPDLVTALRALRAEVERQSATISDLTRERDAAREALAPAAADVLAERRRQVAEEGWTPEHDDAHDRSEIARAAACYALSGTPVDEAVYIHGRWKDARDLFWPWDRAWWKPTDRRRDLVKAGALILAEIERLDRAALSATTKGGADA